MFHFVVEPSFLHHLRFKPFDSANHEMVNFVALAWSNVVFFLIESLFGVDLVVCHLSGKAK